MQCQSGHRGGRPGSSHLPGPLTKTDVHRQGQQQKQRLGRGGDCGGGTQHCAAPRETQGEAGKPQCLSRKARAALGPEKPRKSRPRSTGGRGQREGDRDPCCRAPVPASSSAPREAEGCPAGRLTLWSTILAIKGLGWGGGFFGPALPPPPGPAPRKTAFLCRLLLLGGLLPGRAAAGGQPLSPGHSSLPASSAVRSRAGILLFICSVLCLFLSWLSTRTGKWGATYWVPNTQQPPGRC